MISLNHGDCLEAMRGMEDNQYDLAIVDPPYGIGLKFSDKIKYQSGDKVVVTQGHKQKDWNNQPPPDEYFDELVRVSKKHIVWGCNYYGMNIGKLGQGRIIHNKLPTPLLKSRNASDGDVAATNCQNRVAIFDFQWSGNVQNGVCNTRGINDYERGLEKRVHPTQKPVKLYEWLLHTYAKEGYKILDTHLGGGSIAIACHNLGYDLVAYELDKEYHTLAVDRLKEHTAQLRMF